MLRCGNKKGFSLLELIIAIGVLSIGIVAVFEAFIFSGRVTKFACDIIDASFIAEDKLQELESREVFKLIKEEESASTRGSFSCKYTISPVAQSDLYKLSLVVSWLRLKKQEELSLGTYLR